MIVFLYLAAVVFVVGSMSMTLGPLLAGNSNRKRLLRRLDKVSGRDTLPAPGSACHTGRPAPVLRSTTRMDHGSVADGRGA